MKKYNSLLRALRLCSDQLDKINGIVLEETETLQDNIKAHHVKCPSDDTRYCMNIVTKFDKLNSDIYTNQYRFEKFMSLIRCDK